MNTYVILACLLAVLGACHSNPVGGYGLGYGYGGISTANVYRAAPISVIRTAAVAPIIAPAVTTVPVLRTVGVGYGGYGGYGSGLGWGGYGLGYGRGWGGHGLGGYGLGGYGLGGYGLGGWGGYGHSWGGRGWGGH